MSEIAIELLCELLNVYELNADPGIIPLCEETEEVIGRCTKYLFLTPNKEATHTMHTTQEMLATLERAVRLPIATRTRWVEEWVEAIAGMLDTGLDPNTSVGELDYYLNKWLQKQEVKQ